MAEENKTTDLALTTDDIEEGGEVALINSDSQELDLEEKATSKFEAVVGDVDLVRQIILMLSISVCVALLVIMFFWVKEPEMRPLGQYEVDELIPVLDYLDQEKVEYDLEGNTIHVPANQYDSLRLDLARAGLNQTTQEGDEILLQDMGFGVSQRLEVERLKLSRERQLGETIKQMRKIGQASVLLALPKQSVFVRHNQEASASVFLTLKIGSSLDQEEVDSIIDMVASAVPGMKPTKITVTDQHGRLLNSGSQDPASSARRKEYELERKQEQNLREKIDSVLLPILGIGNYTAQVDVEMDFSSREQTRRQFDPETASIRSEYLLEDYSNGNMVAGVPGALSNQPPADASIPEDIAQMRNGRGLGEDDVHRESTRNFELDTEVSYERAQTGIIKRQTVSIAMKDRQNIDPETGDVTYIPWSEEELTSIRRVIIGSIGFSEIRGDLLNVLSIPFIEPEMDLLADRPIWDHPNFNTWVRWLASSLVIIIVIFALIKPALTKVLNPYQDEDDQLYGPDGMPINEDGETSLLGSELDGSEFFEYGSGINLPDLHKDEDVLKAVRALASNEPALAAQVIKNWIALDDR